MAASMALGSLTELRAGFDLPLHMQIQLKPGTDAAAMLRWLQALPDELATLPCVNTAPPARW